MKYTIRQEEIKDYENVYTVIKKAFETAEQSDGNEQDLVVRLRKGEGFIPQLSLVAIENEKIVGHIMFTKANLGTRTELALAPLSVDPENQRAGVGIALMNEGHKIAKALDYEFSIVLGSEKYYPKAGYKEASTFGVKQPFDVPNENFMALNLKGNDIKINETLEYAKEFFE